MSVRKNKKKQRRARPCSQVTSSSVWFSLVNISVSVGLARNRDTENKSVSHGRETKEFETISQQQVSGSKTLKNLTCPFPSICHRFPSIPKRVGLYLADIVGKKKKKWRIDFLSKEWAASNGWQQGLTHTYSSFHLTNSTARDEDREIFFLPSNTLLLH
jgi:hypothetical protein